jgi:hypothetical protein
VAQSSAHVDRIVWRNAHFVVQRSGYERTVREKVKCVHAWVRGEIVQYPEGTLPHMSRNYAAPQA